VLEGGVVEAVDIVPDYNPPVSIFFYFFFLKKKKVIEKDRGTHSQSSHPCTLHPQSQP
jgi:hypothetical protein